MQTISLVETMPNLSIFQEAAEETGLDDLVVRSHLGSQDYDLSPFGMDETQRWHFYHLGFLGNLPERWRHFERQLADGSPSPIEFYWVEFPGGVPALVAGQGDLLHKL